MLTSYLQAPVVKEPEVTDKDLIVAVESINYAVAEIERTGRMISATRDTILGNNENDMRQMLALSSLHTCTLAETYAIEGFVNETVVVESIGAGGLIIALEEEAAKQKNILIRMIEAVGRAFTWLWEKITGLFKKKKEEAQSFKKDGEELESMLSHLTQEGANFENFEIKDDSYKAFFGFVGKEVKPEDIGKALTDAIPNLESIGNAIDKLLDRTSNLSSVASSIRGDAKADDVMIKLEQFHQAFSGVMKETLKTGYDQNKHRDYPFNVKGFVPEMSFVVSPLPGKLAPHAMGIFYIKAETEKVGKYNGMFVASKMKNADTKLLPPGSLDEIATLVKGVVGYLAKSGDVINMTSGKEAEIKALQATIKSTLDAAKTSASNHNNSDITKPINALVKYASGLGAAHTALMSSFSALTDAGKISKNYATAVMNAVSKSGKTEKTADAATSTETKTESTEEKKPEDTSSTTTPAASASTANTADTADSTEKK